MPHPTPIKAKPVDPSQIIFTTQNIDRKIYVKEQRGRYQSVRRYLSWALMLSFVLLPWLQYDGSQAILFDLDSQRLNFFAWSFYPQDLMIFVFLFVFAAFGLFYVSALYGRVWCGFVCPQTIWTLMFMWVENRVEGNAQQRRALDKAQWSSNKLFKKTLKHLLWAGIALLTALAFMSYFVQAPQLYTDILSFNVSPVVAAWVFTFTLCTYLNAGLVREKMCQHMCPYARFQSAMITSATKQVSYDSTRGEARGPRKRKLAPPEHLGDCVDCDLCVQVCPVGIDIRDGMQYDCINCGLCIDACDQTMKKFGYPLGLIRFAAEDPKPTSKFKHYAYVFMMALTLIASLVWMQQREMFEMTVIKDRNVLYRFNETGGVENAYQLELLNKTNEFKQVKLELDAEVELQIESATHYSLAPNERLSRVITITGPHPEGQTKVFSEFNLSLIDQTERTMVTRSAKFQMPRY